jgi:hypothetical protein
VARARGLRCPGAVSRLSFANAALGGCHCHAVIEVNFVRAAGLHGAVAEPERGGVIQSAENDEA